MPFRRARSGHYTLLLSFLTPIFDTLGSLVPLYLKMVKLDVVRSANTALVQSQPLVAVFFGGTGGIGSYTLRALATAEAQNGGKGVRAYVVGRKAESAERILSECRDICPQGQFKFVQAGDLSLIQGVDQVCAEILELEEKEGQDARIDYLMLSQGGSIFLPRKGIFT
jgi:hypothetical protein